MTFGFSLHFVSRINIKASELELENLVRILNSIFTLTVFPYLLDFGLVRK